MSKIEFVTLVRPQPRAGCGRATGRKVRGGRGGRKKTEGGDEGYGRRGSGGGETEDERKT